jgi:hypothetical protein
MPHGRRRGHRVGVLVLALAALAPASAACESLPDVVAQPEIRCGRFEGPGCSVLADLGRHALHRSTEEPSIVAVAGACPDNARCMPSALGGEEAAVVVRWMDGTIEWATIPLPATWPAGAPGPPFERSEPTPPHLQALVAPGG